MLNQKDIDPVSLSPGIRMQTARNATICIKRINSFHVQNIPSFR